MRLYSETRDKQGQAVAKAWSEVDLAGYFVAQRKEREKLLDAELDSITLRVMADRENEMRLIVAAPVGNLKVRIDEEIKKLVDKDGRAKLAGWMDQSEELNESRSEQADARTRLVAHGQPAFTCTLALKRPNVPAPAKPALDSLITACEREATALGQLDTLQASMGGEVAAAGAEIKSQEQIIEQAKTNAQQGVLTYRAALKAYEDAVKSDPSATKPSQAIVDALRKGVEGLQSLQDAVGKDAQTNEHIAALDELIEQVEAGADPAKDASRREVIAVMSTRIADDLQAIADLEKTSPKAVLLIRRDIEKGRAAVAQMEVAFVERRLALARAILVSRMEEAMLMDLAAKVLEPDPPKPPEPPKPPLLSEQLKQLPYHAALQAKTDDKVKIALYDAPGRYLDAIGRQRAETRKLELMTMALTHEQAVAYGEINAGQWSVLISSVVGQASEFAGGGQKFSDYEGLIDALALLWIGKGVN